MFQRLNHQKNIAGEIYPKFSISDEESVTVLGGVAWVRKAGDRMPIPASQSMSFANVTRDTCARADGRNK